MRSGMFILVSRVLFEFVERMAEEGTVVESVLEMKLRIVQ